MSKLYYHGAVAALASVLAGPAAAQVAGTYSGTSADGNGVSFAVSTDTNTGVLAITGAGVGFTAPCKRSTYVLNTGWGWGPTNDIVKHKVTSVNNGTYFDITFNLVFATDGQSATGYITTISPALDNGTRAARNALYCVSPKQTISVTLQPPGAKPLNIPAGGVVAYPTRLTTTSGKLVAASTH